jgi:2-oxoglutarate dehydrogenase E2 component (dihydrolipoamide succinyltransferase)
VSTGTQIQVVMPQMGVSVSEGTITNWLKQVGDQIAADEPLLEISTDKVDTEVPSPAGGVVAQILVQEGETVEVGTVLALIAPPGTEAATPAPAAPAPAEPAPVEPTPVEPAAAEASAPEPAPAASAPAQQTPVQQAARRRRLRPETGRASCPLSSRASPPSTASTRRPFKARAPAAA